MPVVVDLDRRVDAAQRLEPNLAARWMTRLDLEVLPGREFVRQGDREGLAAVEAERPGALARHEGHRKDAHADEVAAVDALEALRDHRPHAEQVGALRRPVAR